MIFVSWSCNIFTDLSRPRWSWPYFNSMSISSGDSELAGHDPRSPACQDRMVGYDPGSPACQDRMAGYDPRLPACQDRMAGYDPACQEKFNGSIFIIQQSHPSLWPSGMGSCLRQNRSWVRFLAVSDIYHYYYYYYVLCSQIEVSEHSNCRLVPYWREFLGVSGSRTWSDTPFANT